VRRAGGVEQLHQLPCGGERLAGAPPDDLARDLEGEALLAEVPQDSGQLLGVEGVDDLGGGQRGVGIHPHVQWRVVGVGEAALGEIQLHRRDAEVEQHAVHCLVVALGPVAVVTGADERDPVAERRQPLPRDAQRGGVTIEADQPQSWEVGEESLGMAAGT
jgi:hypothetical protein